jgi:hypothetical protein
LQPRRICCFVPRLTLVRAAHAGWPHFEQSVSAWIKDRSKRLDLARLAQEPIDVTDFYGQVERVCMSARPQPATPARFREQISHKTFTNDADHDVVADLYEQTFDEVMRYVRELGAWPASKLRGHRHRGCSILCAMWPHVSLCGHGYASLLTRVGFGLCGADFRGLGWQGVETLCDALEHAQSPALRRLLLQGNEVTVPQRVRLLQLLPEQGQLGLDLDPDVEGEATPALAASRFTDNAANVTSASATADDAHDAHV